MQPLLAIDVLDQLQRLAAHEHQGVDLAGPQSLERDRLGMAGDLDVEAEILEDDARGHERAAALGAEVHPLSGQIVDGAMLGLGEHVHFLVVQPGDVVDPVLDIGHQSGAFVEIEHVRLHDRDVDAAQEQQILDVAHRAFADDRQYPHLVPVIQGIGQVRRDPDIGARDPARNDTHNAAVHQVALGIDVGCVPPARQVRRSRRPKERH